MEVPKIIAIKALERRISVVIKHTGDTVSLTNFMNRLGERLLVIFLETNIRGIPFKNRVYHFLQP